MAGAAPKAIYFYTRVSPLNGYIELIEFRGRTVRLHLCIWRAVGLYLGIALGPLILPSGNWVSLSAHLFLWVWVHSMAGAAPKAIYFFTRVSPLNKVYRTYRI